MMATRLDPMTAREPFVDVEDRNRVGVRAADVLVTDTVPARARRDDRIVARLSKSACSTTHRHDVRRDQRPW